MLNPDTVLSAIVSALRDIPPLVSALGGNPANIIPHYFFSGTEARLAQAIEHQPAPSVLIHFSRLGMRHISGENLFAYYFRAYFRAKNAAQGTNPTAVSAPVLYYLALNSELTSSGQSLRYTRLLDGDLWIMDGADLQLMQDASFNDLWTSELIFLEQGDVPVG